MRYGNKRNKNSSSEGLWDTLNSGDTARWVIGFAAVITIALTFMAYHRFYEPHHDAMAGKIITQTIPAVNSVKSIDALSSKLSVTTTAVSQVHTDKEQKKNNNIKKKPDDESAPTIVQNSKPLILNNNSFSEIHFVHIPKCGGTTMTTVLRQIQCVLNPVKNVDCCTNPGFCDWHAHRRCESIKGCINHFPNRKMIFKPLPSITVFREPTSRLLSAWFYRGHSPNLDFFQVRPYFKEISEGKLPRVKFPEYIEMPEYQNIQTRMLGADSFPYRNITVTDEVYDKAVSAVNRFFFIGLQEEFEVSAKALIRLMGVPTNKWSEFSLVNEREQGSNKQIKKQKQEILENDELMDKVREFNSYDIQLYKIGKILLLY